MSERQPIYPIWEMHISRIVQPMHGLMLKREEEEGVPTFRTEEGRRRMQKGLLLHAFNFEDEGVNLARADLLWPIFGAIYDRTKSIVKPWWPRNAAALLMIVKMERQEMDAYGYIVQSKVARVKAEDKTTQSTLKRKRRDSTPAPQT